MTTTNRIRSERLEVRTTPDDRALIDRAPLPERDVLRAIWFARHGDGAAATDALIRAFTAARTDPWLPQSLLRGGMALAAEIAPTDARLGRALYDGLKEPFAIEAARDVRLLTAAQIAARLPDPAVCVEALSKLEPPQWNRQTLELRVGCYRRASHPRAAGAEADLLELMERDTPLGASIPTPPAPRRDSGDAGAEGGAP